MFVEGGEEKRKIKLIKVMDREAEGMHAGEHGHAATRRHNPAQAGGGTGPKKKRKMSEKNQSLF